MHTTSPTCLLPCIASEPLHGLGLSGSWWEGGSLLCGSFVP